MLIETPTSAASAGVVIVAAAIAALGGKVELAAKVGVDPFGKHLIDVMRSFGVNTKWMLQDENHFTTFAFVSLMENG